MSNKKDPTESPERDDKRLMGSVQSVHSKKGVGGDPPTRGWRVI